MRNVQRVTSLWTRIFSRIEQDYFTQVSEDNEERAKMKFSQEFSRTVSRFLGAPYKLDEFLLKETKSGGKDISQNDPHTEVSVFMRQCSQIVDPDETSYRRTSKMF